MSQEQALAEYLGNNFFAFPGYEHPRTGGQAAPIDRYSAELRAKAHLHTLRRLRLEREIARREALKAQRPVGPVPNTRLARIAHFVSEATGVPVMMLRSVRRQAEYVRARHMFFYLCRECTPASFPAIGAWCSGRDHSTVQYGAEKVAANLAQYPELEKIKSLLGAET